MRYRKGRAVAHPFKFLVLDDLVRESDLYPEAEPHFEAEVVIELVRLSSRTSSQSVSRVGCFHQVAHTQGSIHRDGCHPDRAQR
jgi:hypothetical protein